MPPRRVRVTKRLKFPVASLILRLFVILPAPKVFGAVGWNIWVVPAPKGFGAV